MVLVRIRLEKEDGSVHFFKSFITLPADIPVSKLCSDTIGPKIGVVDFTNYIISDIGSSQDGTPQIVLNSGDILAGKVKNGEWLLVKYTAPVSTENVAPITTEVALPPVVNPPQTTPLTTETTLSAEPPTTTPQLKETETKPILQPSTQTVPTSDPTPQQTIHSTPAPEPETQPPQIQPPQTLQQIESLPSQSIKTDQPQSTIVPTINAPTASNEPSSLNLGDGSSSTRPISPLPPDIGTSGSSAGAASPSLARARMQRRNSIDSSTLFRFKTAGQSPLNPSPITSATTDQIPSTPSDITTTPTTISSTPTAVTPSTPTITVASTSNGLPQEPIINTPSIPPVTVADIPQIPLINTAAVQPSLGTGLVTPKSPIPRLLLETLAPPVINQLPSPNANLPPPIAALPSPTTIPPPPLSFAPTSIPPPTDLPPPVLPAVDTTPLPPVLATSSLPPASLPENIHLPPVLPESIPPPISSPQPAVSPKVEKVVSSPTTSREPTNPPPKISSTKSVSNAVNHNTQTSQGTIPPPQNIHPSPSKSIATPSSSPKSTKPTETRKQQENKVPTQTGRSPSSASRSKVKSDASRWICETTVREVVEEVLVECVDVRNYYRRSHVFPTFPRADTGNKKDAEQQPTASITAQLTQMTEEFGRVVGALEHLQGFVTSLQTKAGMPPQRPASSAASYPQLEEAEFEKSRGHRSHDSASRRKTMDGRSASPSPSRQVQQSSTSPPRHSRAHRSPSPSRISPLRPASPHINSLPPHTFSRTSTPIPNSIPLPHPPPRFLVSTPIQPNRSGRSVSPSRAQTPILYTHPRSISPPVEPPSPSRTHSPIPVRPPSPIPVRIPSPPPQIRPSSPPRTRSPSRVQALPPDLYTKPKKTKPPSEEVHRKQANTSRSTPPQQNKLSSTQPLRTSYTRPAPRTLGSTYTALAAAASSNSTSSSSSTATPPKNSKSKSAPPSTNKRAEKKYSDTQNLRNVGEVISNLSLLDNKRSQQNTPDFSNNTYPEPISHNNATPIYPSIQHNQAFDSNGKDFDSLSAYNPLRDTVHNANANTTYNTTFNTTIHHQVPISNHHMPSSNYNNLLYNSTQTMVSHRPQSPTRTRPQESILITFTTSDGGEYIVPLHTARHSRIVSATLATSMATAVNHRFEFNTVISEVMGAILKFLENPFMHFLNTLTGSLILPSNPFQHIGAAKALLAGDSMEIPLVIVYCTSLLLSAGHTKELQQYLPTTFLFQRSPIADWYSLQDIVDSLLPTTATHSTSPSPSRTHPSSVVTTTTTRPSCENGMDFLWHVRFTHDFGAGDISYREAALSWKRVYAESRVQSFLLAGLDQLDELELVQWKRFMGPLVQSLDLSESSVHDGVVSLVLRLCTNLQRLDLHKSHITDESLLLIAEAAREGHELTWVNLQYTHVSREGLHSFSLCCPNTSIVL